MAVTGGHRRPLAGRDAELRQIARLVERVAGGETATLLVSGPAGMGKTSLVDQALSEPSGAVVLRGVCLPVPSLSSGLLPLRTALRYAPTPESVNRACLAAMEAGRAIEGLEAYLDAVTPTAPVVFVVDDVQWAEPLALEVLLYLVAAPQSRRYGVVLTLRSGEGAEADHVQRWLADVLRLPAVEHRELGPLSRADTEVQLARLIATMPHQSLVDEVFARTGGNPYFTTLLARGLDPTARHAPADLPADLVVAVRRLTRDLPDPAREVASLLAIGGGPTSAAALAAVAGDLGMADVPAGLDRAEAAGLVVQVGSGRLWFSHPLQPELLVAQVPTSRRRRWHAAFAARLEATLRDRPVTVEDAPALVAHHEGAGQLRAAYGWALAAWDAASAEGRAGATLPVACRAVELRAEVPGAAEPLEDLWVRLRATAAEAGAEGVELDAVEQLLAAVDPTERPVLVGELLIRRAHLRLSGGLGFLERDSLERAAALTSEDPASWQHALALAEVVHARVWDDEADLDEPAAYALERARRTGHPRALSYALTAQAMADLAGDRVREAVRHAAAAVEHAALARDWWGYVHAVLWESNADPAPVDPDGLRQLRVRREALAALGAPFRAQAQIAAVEAGENLMGSNWSEAERRLRFTLGTDPGVFADAPARLNAALLAAWQGRPEVARAHLDRADELVPGGEDYPNFPYAAIRAIVLLEEGRAAEAFAVAARAADRDGAPVHRCEWLVPTACRALADCVASARGTSGADTGALGDLAAFRAAHPTAVVDPGFTRAEYRTRVEVMNRWAEAEVARVLDQEGAGERWSGVAEAAESVGLCWLEAYAWWRAAAGWLERRGSGHSAGVRCLRRGYALATRLPAAAVRAQLEALAETARIGLVDTPDAELPVAVLPGLTRREQEIVRHLVTGRTYAEIAQALVISEKTVSSHVSNVLRKTGSRSRVELSQRVRHLAGPG